MHKDSLPHVDYRIEYKRSVYEVFCDTCLSFNIQSQNKNKGNKKLSDISKELEPFDPNVISLFLYDFVEDQLEDWKQNCPC